VTPRNEELDRARSVGAAPVARLDASTTVGPESRLGRLWRRIRVCFVQDVPVSIDLCEVCREVVCTQGRWETCDGRLRMLARPVGS